MGDYSDVDAVRRPTTLDAADPAGADRRLARPTSPPSPRRRPPSPTPAAPSPTRPAKSRLQAALPEWAQAVELARRIDQITARTETLFRIVESEAFSSQRLITDPLRLTGGRPDPVEARPRDLRAFTDDLLASAAPARRDDRAADLAELRGLQHHLERGGLEPVHPGVPDRPGDRSSPRPGPTP